MLNRKNNHNLSTNREVSVVANEASIPAIEAVAKINNERRCEQHRSKITDAVDTFMGMMKNDVSDEARVSYIDKLAHSDNNDAIDSLIVSLDDAMTKGDLTQQQVLDNADKLLQISPDKYRTVDDLLRRRQWLKDMNLEHPEMPLAKNHELVSSTFDDFNQLIGTDFDAYYVGGLMAYLAANKPLERYHSDLDLYINENDLAKLRERVASSDEFSFHDNTADKTEDNGHEYVIYRKHTPMSVGLFLFDRNDDGSITRKSYYRSSDNKDELSVREDVYPAEYVANDLSDKLWERNGHQYKMTSLESIYHNKKDGRPKDRYDASVIRDSVDMDKVAVLDAAKAGIITRHHPVDELPL